MKSIQILINQTIESLPGAIATTIAGSFIAGVCLILVKLKDHIFQFLMNHISNTYIVTTFFISFILLTMSISLNLFYYFKKKTKLFLKYGVYWDNECNPYCSTCKKPLQIKSTESYGVSTFICVKCKEPLKFVDDFGKYLPLNLVKQNVIEMFVSKDNKK